MTKEKPLIREYRNTDKDGVLNLLRLNTPEYFSSSEEPELIYYLENEIEYYFVMELNNQVIGSGGINFENEETGILSWDILHPEFQGKGFGSMLVKHRIEKLKGMKEVTKIIVRTSQLTHQFYEKLGFRLTETIEDYWAKGFHLYRMVYAG